MLYHLSRAPTIRGEGQFEGRLYLKVDDQSKGDFASRGMEPFRPNPRQTIKSYHEVPPTLPSRMDENPMAWMIQRNGFLVDARILKREIQEEALRKGLIPYIPERPQPLKEDDESDDSDVE